MLIPRGAFRLDVRHFPPPGSEDGHGHQAVATETAWRWWSGFRAAPDSTRGRGPPRNGGDQGRVGNPVPGTRSARAARIFTLLGRERQASDHVNGEGFG